MFDYRFQWTAVWNEFPALMAGAVVTLQITALSIVFGTLCGIVLLTATKSGSRALQLAATTWVEIARNTPCLFQIYVAYFGLGEFGIHISSFAAVLLAITFNNAGYLAEIFRGGYEAIPPTQTRAARSLGMTSWKANVYVVAPQIVRLVYFPFVNQVQWAMLSSSLGLIVGLHELTGATQFAQSQSFRTFEFFFIAAAIYYVISKILQTVAWVVFRATVGGRA